MATRRERQKMYEELKNEFDPPKRSAKADAPRKSAPSRSDDDAVFMLTGKKADDFLNRLFGGSQDDDQDQDDEEQDDDEDDDEDQDDDEDDDEDDPAPPPGHRFFKSRTRQ